MREILFKAKRIDNGEWVEGNIILSKDADEEYKAIIIPSVNSNMFTQDSCDKDLGFENWYKVDPSTICQYTGLTDMNGQKIWENDILCGNLDDMYPGDKTYAQVIWHKNGWYTKESDSIDRNLMDEFDEHFFAVVGNIFDNGDLTK